MKTIRVIQLTDWYALDGIVAILIAVVVLFSTSGLFKDNAIAILDGVPASVNSAEIKKHLLEVSGVVDIHHLHIWGISTNENALTAHVTIDDTNRLPEIKKVLKSELEEHLIKHSTLEFELSEEKCDETTL